MKTNEAKSSLTINIVYYVVMEVFTIFAFEIEARLLRAFAIIVIHDKD